MNWLLVVHRVKVLFDLAQRSILDERLRVPCRQTVTVIAKLAKRCIGKGLVLIPGILGGGLDRYALRY